MRLTAHAKTVDALLVARGTSLAAFITEKRGDGLSFARVATALATFTGGVVDVTGQTVNNWATDLGIASADEPVEVAS